MAESKLDGKRVAILVANGFEQVELTEPRKALEDAGAETHVVSPVEDRVKGWEFDHWGDEVEVDVPLPEAAPELYDALLLPGGQMNPDDIPAFNRTIVEEFARAGTAAETAGASAETP